MDYEKQLFEQSKANAPNDFVAKTMKHIRLKEMEEEQKTTAKIEYSFFKIGQICVVASLLLVALNVFPAIKDVYSQGTEPNPPQHQSLVQKAFEKCEDIFEGIKELIDIDNIIEKK